jgi:hypothetical protein
VSKVEVTVLEGAFAESEIISYAMHMNSTAGFAVVPTTYLDKLAAGRRFLQAVTTEFLAKVAGGVRLRVCPADVVCHRDGVPLRDR